MISNTFDEMQSKMDKLNNDLINKEKSLFNNTPTIKLDSESMPNDDDDLDIESPELDDEDESTSNDNE